MAFREIGKLPHALQLRSGTLRGIHQPDTLAAVLATAQPFHLVAGEVGDLPASRLVPDPALSGSVLHGQVVLKLRGRDAIFRLWPSGVPDTVSLSFRGPGRQTEEFDVPVLRLRKAPPVPG